MSESLLRFDEINKRAEEIYAESSERKKREDDLEDFLIDMISLGVAEANSELSVDIELPLARVEEILNEPVEGKTWRQRIDEGIESTGSEWQRLVETESHRVFLEAKTEVAEQSGVRGTKTWITMLDDRVRETHEYLEGAVVPINGYFYTYDGDKAKYPGGFTLAQNNVNCRCSVSLKRL